MRDGHREVREHGVVVDDSEQPQHHRAVDPAPEVLETSSNHVQLRLQIGDPFLDVRSEGAQAPHCSSHLIFELLDLELDDLAR